MSPDANAGPSDFELTLAGVSAYVDQLGAELADPETSEFRGKIIRESLENLRRTLLMLLAS